MPRRTPQTKADKAIAQLTDEQRSHLIRLCQEHANATDVHRYLTTFSPDVSYDSLLTWYSREYGNGEKARSVNGMVSGCRGLNPVDIHAASLAAVVTITEKIMELVTHGGIRDLTPSLLSNLVDLLREQRQSAQALGARERMTDRRSTALAAIYRLAEVQVNLVRDTPHHEAVKSAVDAALAKVEEEL